MRSVKDIIKLFKDVHGDKYDYSLVDKVKTKEKVKIICPIHGEFEQIISGHLRGYGCKKCGIEISNNKKTKKTSQFISEAINVHGDKYDYSLVDYKHSHKKVKIICPIHGEFEQNANSHLQGAGCSYCFVNNKLKDKSYFLKLSYNVHGDKYDYSLVDYKKMKEKVKIICPIHGEFEQRPDNHIQGQGCPNCISVTYTSKNEKELQNWLSKMIEIKTNDKKLIYPYEIDILIPSKKIAIEYNGLYWHSEQQGKDKNYHLKKFNLCKQKGYRLIQIWDNEWILKQEIVKSIILNSLGMSNFKYHGRKCKIKEIKPEQAKIFYNNNHIQGFKGGKHIGLFYNDKMVSLMTIDSKNELQRFVNKKFSYVHGAFSKLLKAFNKKYIYTFADIRYFTGNVYLKNGFEYIHTTPPNYYYFKKLLIYHRMHFQKKNILKKFNSGYLQYFDPMLTEYQNMLNNGFDRIWDCGNLKFELIFN